jgi:Tfp pilus assembly protein PilZ
MPIRRAYELGFAWFMRGFLTLFCLVSCLFIVAGLVGWVGPERNSQYPAMAGMGVLFPDHRIFCPAPRHVLA